MAPTPQSVKASATVCAEAGLSVTQSYLPGKAEKTLSVVVSKSLPDGACFPAVPAQVANATQPMPTPDPELGMKVKNATGVPVNRSVHRYPRKFRHVLDGVRSFFAKALLLLWIGFVYVLPGAIMSVLVVVVFISIPFAISAASGSIAMLTGNGVLRAANLAHYTDNRSAAAIGSLGAVVSSLVLLPLHLIGINDSKDNNQSTFIKILISVVFHTLSGALGSSILLSFHVDLGPIDVLHATRAGAVGGAILGPALCIAIPLIVVALGLVIAPLWIGLELVLKWYRGHLSDAYNNGEVFCMCQCEIRGNLWDDDIV